MERVSEWTDVGGYSRVITTTIIARHDSTTGQRRVVSPQKMKRTRRTAHLRSNILDRDDPLLTPRQQTIPKRRLPVPTRATNGRVAPYGSNVHVPGYFTNKRRGKEDLHQRSKGGKRAEIL